jgi:hypothetical protein
MSATLIIGTEEQHSVWMPASGTYEEILSLIVEGNSNNNVKLILRDAIVQNHSSISALSSQEMASLLETVETIFKIMRGDFQRYGDIFFAFSQLKALLRLDPRTENRSYTQSQRSIVLNSNSIWRSEMWIVEFVVESIASFLANWYKNPLYQELLDEYHRESSVHMEDIGKETLCQIIKTVSWLKHYFKEKDKGRMAYSDTYNSKLSIEIPKLQSLLLNDSRSKECLDI